MKLIITLLALLVALPVYAEQLYVQVDYSFEVNDTATIPVGYRLYQDGSALRTIADLDGSFEVPCVDVPMGPSSFTLSAVYADGSESQQSDPFQYNVPRCENVLIITIGTNIR